MNQEPEATLFKRADRKEEPLQAKRLATRLARGKGSGKEKSREKNSDCVSKSDVPCYLGELLTYERRAG